MTSQSFKELTVWQKSIILSKDIYKLTSLFPQTETFGLTSQMRRSAVSIPSNIAEGSKRKSKKDFILFLRMASGSGAELETQLLIAKDLYPNKLFSNCESLLLEIQKMLTSFIKKLETP